MSGHGAPRTADQIDATGIEVVVIPYDPADPAS